MFMASQATNYCNIHQCPIYYFSNVKLNSKYISHLYFVAYYIFTIQQSWPLVIYFVWKRSIFTESNCCHDTYFAPRQCKTSTFSFSYFFLCLSHSLKNRHSISLCFTRSRFVATGACINKGTDTMHSACGGGPTFLSCDVARFCWDLRCQMFLKEAVRRMKTSVI